MLRKGLTLIMTLGFISASALSARADLCFHYGSGGGIAIAKGGKIPPKNTCGSLAMFEVGGYLGAATGSICTAADTQSAIYHYVFQACTPTHYFETGTCTFGLQNGALPQGGSTGECNIVHTDPNTSPTPVGGFDSTLNISNCEGVDTTVFSRFQAQCKEGRKP